MKGLLMVSMCAGALAGVAVSIAACSSDNQPSTTPPGGGSSSSGSGASSGSGGTGSSSGASSGSSSGAGGSSGGAASDGGGGQVDASMTLCPSGLQDKTTPCTGTEPTCVKGCGPDLATGVNGNLGTKSCACNAGTMVYNCQACAYPSPLPACYMPASLTPPACAAGVADKTACTTACSGVCSMVSDAGKTQGCVCVMLSSGATQWSCATQWW